MRSRWGLGITACPRKLEVIGHGQSRYSLRGIVASLALLCARSQRPPDRDELHVEPRETGHNCASCMLMHPDDCGVDDQMFKVGGLRPVSQKCATTRRSLPAPKALEDRVSIAKFRRQIAPRCAGASQPKHRLHKQAVVLSVTTGIAIPGQEVRSALTARRRDNDAPFKATFIAAP